MTQSAFDSSACMHECGCCLPGRLKFLAAMLREGELVDGQDGTEACRAPRDDKFLELAISGGADYIVTGDSDLLELNPFRGIAIFTPGQFLEVQCE